MTVQETLSLIIVAAAAFYLIRHFSRTKKEGCGGDCSCDNKIVTKSTQKN